MMHFTSFAKAAVVAVMAAGFCSAQAADGDYVVEDMQLGVTYDVNDSYLYHDFIGVFTPAQDMRVRAEFNLSMIPFEVWEDAEHNVRYPGVEYNNGNNYVNIDVKKGKPVYFYQGFIMNPFTLTLMNAEDAVVVLMDVSLPAGQPLSVSTNSFLDFHFSDTVSVGKAKIVNGDTEAEAAVSTIDGGTVARVEIAPVLMNWYAADKLHAGDQIDVIITNVNSGGKPVGGEEGIISVSYTAMGRPISLVRTQNIVGKPFLSYYLPTNPDALLKFEFDGPLMPLDNKAQRMEAYISIGDVSNVDNYFREYMKVELSDDLKTVILDLAGVRRTRADMNVQYDANDPSTGGFSINLVGVMGENGQYAYASDSGSIGSYAYFMEYKEVSSNMTVDYTPARGQKVNAGQDMEIYIVGLSSIDFSGIEFAYGDKKYVVEKKDLTIVVDPEDDTANLIQFKMPELEGIAEGEEITMTFADLVCADGYDHSAQLTCNYVAGNFSGIAEIVTDGNVNSIYSIDGRKVKGNLQKGLYIIGGKKVMVK